MQTEWLVYYTLLFIKTWGVLSYEEQHIHNRVSNGIVKHTKLPKRNCNLLCDFFLKSTPKKQQEKQKHKLTPCSSA